ncbi:PTS ascorbate transporter subunit IIC [Sporosalibacterium faouarense]|uniref:PTS ascorbate transporter subunit IIC n=1 Tax=Sporosalibacterium faouarense TaxID=516123 RepID=UPI00141C09AD|nr:PTS ascorbate transporter subunit IIC [Sporosalibacterium faouarense]MTI49873.1 PTS ascorbate transporter subunit IIC [Bacillota bacterium]
MLDLILDILSVPAILVGLIALIGLVVQKKPSSDVFKGTIKTILGFLVLSGGAAIAVDALGHFGVMFQEAFNVQGVVPHNEAVVAMALEKFGTSTALIMAFGMLANILIARFTKLKYIFLTGHHTLYMACMIAVILVVGGLEGTVLIIVGSILLGLVMALFPAIAHPTMKKITGTDDVAFGHFGTVGYVLSAWVGKLVGKNSKSTEEMKFPKGLGFLRDSSVAVAIVMGLFYIVVAIASGKTFVEELSDGQNFIIFAIIQAITFAGGVYIILAGVRLILAEIIPAFKGISEKIVPDAKPALDCPVVFPYAPNAVLIGFLSSFLGGIVGMLVLIGMKATIILPGVVPHFFCGATAGVFGNATGGKRGAFLGAFAHGLLITFLPVLLMPVLGDLGFANTTFSDADFGVVGIILGNIIKIFVH